MNDTHGGPVPENFRHGSRFESLVGKTYGRWHVMYECANRSHGKIYYHGKCDCGNESDVSACDLKTNKSRSCGCLNLELINLRISEQNPISIGDRFGRLTVIKQLDTVQNKRYWLCKCRCGNAVRVPTSCLMSGVTRSCGCYQKDRASEVNTIFKCEKERHLGKILSNMKSRCYNPNISCYKNYGGRGITICDEWLNDTMNFVRWAMANGYEDGLEIDRIDNDGPYAPWNCRWVTRDIQSVNKRTNINLDVHGITRCCARWDKYFGMRKRYFQEYYHRYGHDATCKLIEDKLGVSINDHE